MVGPHGSDLFISDLPQMLNWIEIWEFEVLQNASKWFVVIIKSLLHHLHCDRELCPPHVHEWQYILCSNAQVCTGSWCKSDRNMDDRVNSWGTIHLCPSTIHHDRESFSIPLWSWCKNACSWWDFGFQSMQLYTKQFFWHCSINFSGNLSDSSSSVGLGPMG